MVLTLNVVYSNISNKRSVEFYLFCTKDLLGAVSIIHHTYIYIYITTDSKSNKPSVLKIDRRYLVCYKKFHNNGHDFVVEN